ncbi:MAG: hypothetical protein IJK62_08290 [Bacteroidales bacterium]|nr:hypothetical protein [Prevotella sp.]MBQ6276689.1 hypothetical protein [Bacteroidales bacterium]
MPNENEVTPKRKGRPKGSKNNARNKGFNKMVQTLKAILQDESNAQREQLIAIINAHDKESDKAQALAEIEKIKNAYRDKHNEELNA